MTAPTNDKIKNFKPRWLLLLAIIFFITLTLAGAGLLVFDKMFREKIYPNVFVGDLDLGGKNSLEARRLVNKAIDKISQQGVAFSYQDAKTVIAPVVASTNGDFAYQIINFDGEQTAAEAMSYGRSGDWLKNSVNKLLSLFKKKQIPLALLANREEMEKILKNNFSQAIKPAADACLKTEKLQTGTGYKFSITQEEFGKTIDYQKAIGLMLNGLENLEAGEIKLSTITQYPKILAKDCLNIESKAEALLAVAPLTLTYGENKWALSLDQLAGLLALKPNNSAQDKVRVGLDSEKFKAYLTEQVAPTINKKPVEAKFKLTNGKVTEFQNGQDGLELDLDASLDKLESEMMFNNQIELTVKVQPILTKAGDINNLGIKEIIGVGTSNFAGSPVNRRHNIKVGAAAVSGSLIKPGEEFSLLKTLGDVSGSTGYLPELVIKEGRTVPEYGGGLCQIGTTVFRSVIASGLPVTIRRNHSYRVGYYEPAGTDATIYNPWPDFRFINDTANYILIQSKISGDDLSFEFWGTRDGRLMEKTAPVIYNIVKPGPTKIIETLDLKPGVKKCTESAHNGADAYFDYKVTYADGVVKANRFSSHYVPWRAVCLLGVAELSPPPETATSTLPILTN